MAYIQYSQKKKKRKFNIIVLVNAYRIPNIRDDRLKDPKERYCKLNMVDSW